MADTHGVSGEGWYGFDLDGTLAKYDGWKGIDNIGEPIKPMVDLIKQMHADGKVVKIMTARVAPRKVEEGAKHEASAEVPEYARGKGSTPELQAWIDAMYTKLTTWRPVDFITDWCLRELGFWPEIVYQKDPLMLELYDDRVKQVVPNAGWLVEDIAASKRQRVETTLYKHEILDARWYDRLTSFLLGFMLGAIVLGVLVCVLHRDSVPEAERKLQEAVEGYFQAHERDALMKAVPFSMGKGL